YDVAWESSSNDCMVAYGLSNGNVATYIFNGTNWSAGASNNIGGSATFVRIESDPSSDRIGLSTLDGSKDWNVNVWTGSGWGTAPGDEGNVGNITGRSMDCAWEKDSGKFVAVNRDSGANQVSYVYWQSSSWSVADLDNAPQDTTQWSTSLNYLQMRADPSIDDIFVIGVDSNGQLRSLRWDPSTNSFSDAVTHTSSISDSTRESCMFAFDRYDTADPQVLDNQDGDDTWRNANTGIYDVDFQDYGNAKISYFQTYITSSSYPSGTPVEGWTTQLSGINQMLYETDWSLTSGTFEAMNEGINYVSIRVYDDAENVSTISEDTFYVKKDTTTPTVDNGEIGGDTDWKNAAGTTYDVTFADTGGSLLKIAEYAAYTEQAYGGDEKIGWTPIKSNINAFTYGIPWEVSFNLLAPGTNYISVRVSDYATSTTTVQDAFYILKDTIAPFAVTDLTAEPGTTQGQIQLTWTAPGDDGKLNNNTQGSYVAKYFTEEITDLNWNDATTIVQTWTPKNAGQIETRIITGLTAGDTYYFALKTRDKLPNESAISNSPFAIAQEGGIFVNELYSAGASAGADWIELYNGRDIEISLDGWTLVYNQGTIGSPGSEQTVWTGGVSDVLSSGTVMLVTPSANLSASGGTHLKLFDDMPSLVDQIQMPALSVDTSFARIADSSQYFEVDPSPTKNMTNNIATETVKINEISYDTAGTEFIELYNIDTSQRSLTGWMLRNNEGNCFTFNRVVQAEAFTAVDFSSIDTGEGSYTDHFGTTGLSKVSDFVVLENSSGQAIDRVTWQFGSTYRYYDYQTNLVSYENPAPANTSTPGSIGRDPDGDDTDVDENDFSVITTGSEGASNSLGIESSSNTIHEPSTQTMARHFRIDIDLGEASATGTSDTLIFIRTNGADDNYSPHIYNLTDLGFDLSELEQQTTAQTGYAMLDQDGHPLVDGSQYRLVLYTDTDQGRAQAEIKNNIIYDASIHKVTASDTSPTYLNVSVKDDLVKINVVSESPANANGIEIAQVKARLLDESAQALTTVEAQALFTSLSIVRDSSQGIVGTYENSIDTDTIASVSNAAISLDLNGLQVFTVSDPDAAAALVDATTTGYFYLVAELTSGATNQNPSVFRVAVDPDTGISLRDQPSDVYQDIIAGAEVIISSVTPIVPAPPPANTNWPTTVTSEPIYGGANLSDDSSTVYTGSDDGKIYAMDSDGDPSWTYTPDTTVPIRKMPLVVKLSDEKDHIFFANENGEV
ncbi:MAG: hypothetical protein GF384_06735, partial [Elusimicrobia bacterium]|nr:hypothetical protein [Elusimicrobiota bacterium]MBD3412398.1 hypothetical protein [Elusimicrobiota bacterium]